MVRILAAALVLLFACSDPSANPQEAQHALLFDSAWKSGDSIFILKVRTEISSAQERNPFVLYSRAWLLSRKGETSRSLKTADSLVMGYPAFARGHYLRANLKANSGNLEGAFKDYENALRRDPSLFEAYMNRGALYFQDKHPEHAIPDFKKALQLRKADGQVWVNLGNAFASAGSPDSACHYWRKAEALGSGKAIELVAKFCSAP